MLTHNLQDSAVRLSPDLRTVRDYFTPFDTAIPTTGLDAKDNDLSAGGVMVVPDQTGIQPRVVVTGKGGTLYVMNRTLGQMGGYVPGGPDKPKTRNVGKCKCGPSYFLGSDGIGRIVTSTNNLSTWLNTATFPNSPEAQYQMYPTAAKDSFFTSVSSNGTQAGTAIIWAVQRPTTTPPANVTLYAFNATPQNGTFTVLYSAPAGTWNVSSNANIVPVVANGHVYVASYQALTIFGLQSTGQLAAVKQLAPLTTTAVQTPAEPAGPQIFGAITSMTDNQVKVRLRTGASVNVDLTEAFRRHDFNVPYVGENVELHGSFAANGDFNAKSLWEIQNPVTWKWGPDRR